MSLLSPDDLKPVLNKFAAYLRKPVADFVNMLLLERWTQNSADKSSTVGKCPHCDGAHQNRSQVWYTQTHGYLCNRCYEVEMLA